MSFTPDEVDKLKLLMRHFDVREYNHPQNGKMTELRLKNVAVYTDIQGAGAVFVIDGSTTNGVQRAADIRGPMKCLICDEYNEIGIVCPACKGAMGIMRVMGRSGAVSEVMQLLQSLDEQGLIEALKLVTRENIQAWMVAEAEGMK